MRWPPRYVCTALAALVGVGATSMVAACDTGDGKDLSPPEFPPPTSTIASTIDSVSPAGAAATTLPIQPFTLVAPWQDGGDIPVRNTCDGEDVAPALSWTAVPDGAVELALVVTDDDADGFVHWVMSGFDPAIRSILEGQVPQGARQWRNMFGAPRWNGPCPSPGSSHTYRFVLYAIDQPLGVADDIATDALFDVINTFTVGSATVTGVFAR